MSSAIRLINSGQSSSKRITAVMLAPLSRLRYLLPLVLIAALAVPVGASAHRLQLSSLVNKVDQVAQARVDASQGYWSFHEIQERSCFLSRGDRMHRHFGGCEVRFYRADEHPCEYEIRLRLKSRENRFHMPPTYKDLQPEDFTCPARP